MQPVWGYLSGLEPKQRERGKWSCLQHAQFSLWGMLVPRACGAIPELKSYCDQFGLLLGSTRPFLWEQVSGEEVLLWTLLQWERTVQKAVNSSEDKEKASQMSLKAPEQIASPWKDTSSEPWEYSQGTNWWRIWMGHISSKEVCSFLQTE